jgi:PAS domain S-box-containing protein
MGQELDAVLNALPGLVWTALRGGLCDFVNQPWCEYTGLSPTQASGQGWHSAIHAEDLPNLVAVWPAEDVAGTRDIEARLRNRVGEYHPFRIRIIPVRDATGTVLRTYLVGLDSPSTDALLTGERRLLDMVVHGHSLSEILDTLCRLIEDTAKGCYCSVVLVDPTGSRLEHGAAPSLPASFIGAIVGRPVGVDSGPSAMAADLNEQVIASDLTAETRWAASGWRSMALEHGIRAVWAMPIPSTSGQVRGAFAIYHDKPRKPAASDQRIIEQFTNIASIAIERWHSHSALQRSEARKSAIMDSALDCIVTIDHEGRITEFNPSAELTFGYRREDVTGRYMAEVIVPPALREQHRAGFARYLATDEAHVLGKRLELVAVRADGTEFPVELTITRIRLDGPPSFTGYLRDITDRKQAEKNLRSSEEALRNAQADIARIARLTTMGELVASIAHEVSQPLGAVMTNANACLTWLNREQPNLERARQSAQLIIRDAGRAGEVLHGIRTLARKSGPQLGQLDINDAIREVLALTRNEMAERGVALHTALTVADRLVLGDRVQLQQVLLNLMLNGMEAMTGITDRPRMLAIRSEPLDPTDILVAVEDNGTGLDPAFAARIFEPFFTTKPQGMGMGLSICRSIIDAHGGRFWVAPREPCGTVFRFTVPAAGAPRS